MDTKEAIKKQFMDEYTAKEYSLITVKGLCAATPVARTTFYSYFDNTDEVKNSVEDDLINGLIAVAERVSDGDMPGMDFDVFMNETERYIKEQWTYIYAFLVKQPNLRFIRKWKDAIKYNFRRRYPEKQKGKNYEAIAEIMASAVVSGYTYWMENPDTNSTDEIKPILKNLLESLVLSM